jgi:hypothetical protein
VVADASFISAQQRAAAVAAAAGVSADLVQLHCTASRELAALSTGSDECPDWGTAARAVPDLLEEMVQRTLDEDGQVTVIRDAPFSIAAKLRFPVTERPAVKSDRAGGGLQAADLDNRQSGVKA